MNPTLQLYDICNLPPWNGRACLRLAAKGGGLPKLNYEKLYGMKINRDFEVIAIGYSGGGTDEAYNRTYSVSTGNPTAALTRSLIERGVTVYMCQNTMRGNGWVTSDLLPGVKMVPSGAVAVLDFEYQGYKYILP